MSTTNAQVSATISTTTKEKLGFIALEGVREGRLHGDPVPMFLDIHSIAAAFES